MNTPTGYSALDLVGFTPKGDYSGSATYVQNDIVRYNNNLWRCKLDDTSAQTPAEGTYWTLFIEGSTLLSSMTDTAISSPANGDVLEYDSTSGKWKNSDVIGEVKQALSDEVSARARLGAHNFLPNQVSTTTGNVTGVTHNDDGTVTIAPRTGIPSGDLYFSVRGTRDFFLPNGTYIMSGGRDGNIYLGAGYTKKDGGYDSYGYANATDLIFTVDGCNLRDDGAYLTTWLVVNGDVSSQLTIYPMIRLATDSDPTYQTHAMTNRELTDYVTQHSFGTAVDLSSQSSYECPSDGYVAALIEIPQSNAYVTVNGIVLLQWSSQSAAAAIRQSVFVRKGMTIAKAGTFSEIKFYPLA